MTHRPIRFVHLLILAVCAALAFGGSFTCKSSTHDDDVIVTPNK